MGPCPLPLSPRRAWQQLKASSAYLSALVLSAGYRISDTSYTLSLGQDMPRPGEGGRLGNVGWDRHANCNGSFVDLQHHQIYEEDGR